MKRRRLVAVLILLASSLAIPIADNEAIHAQSVQDFEFSSFEADYYLSKDNEGRSRLRVVERLTAEFPGYDQNKGIVRAIPISYEGRPVSFELESVKRNGSKEPVYDKSTEEGLRIIELGTDDYVHGTQVYEITYTMRDVIRDLDDYQEFFWDTNGVQWQQSFRGLTARVHLDEAVEDNFAGKARCYKGVEGSTNQCSVGSENDTLVFKANDTLGPGETVSMLMEFEPNTFMPYDEGVGGIVRSAIAWLSIGLALAALLAAVWVRFKNRDAKGRGVIVPRYNPPEELSVLMAASIGEKKKMMKKGVPAQFIDLAVRGNVAIVELKKKKLFVFNATQYIVELKDRQGLNPEEGEMIEAFFGASHGKRGSKRKSASQFNMSEDQPDNFKTRMLRKSLQGQVITQGYRQESKGNLLPYALAAIAVVAGFSLMLEMSRAGFSDWRMGAFVAGIAALGGIGLLIGGGVHPLTDKGRNIVDHLEGLKSYIQLVEAERLQVLQSPEGAQTNPVDTNDKQQIVKLYEELLPYAVLFGQEKQWSRQLSVYYNEARTAPTWYSGASGFNASGFASSVNSFTSSASSGSSGFSGGGAGGGGGGGGGGGR